MPATAHRDPALFRSTLELLPAGAYTCDPAGRITWFNELAVSLTRLLTWITYSIAAHQYRAVPQVAKAQPSTRASVPPQPG